VSHISALIRASTVPPYEPQQSPTLISYWYFESQ
jgi:hypothetical protein